MRDSGDEIFLSLSRQYERRIRAALRRGCTTPTFSLLYCTHKTLSGCLNLPIISYVKGKYSFLGRSPQLITSLGRVCRHYERTGRGRDGRHSETHFFPAAGGCSVWCVTTGSPRLIVAACRRLLAADRWPLPVTAEVFYPKPAAVSVCVQRERPVTEAMGDAGFHYGVSLSPWVHGCPARDGRGILFCSSSMLLCTYFVFYLLIYLLPNITYCYRLLHYVIHLRNLIYYQYIDTCV